MTYFDYPPAQGTKHTLYFRPWVTESQWESSGMSFGRSLSYLLYGGNPDIWSPSLAPPPCIWSLPEMFPHFLLLLYLEKQNHIPHLFPLVLRYSFIDYFVLFSLKRTLENFNSIIVFTGVLSSINETSRTYSTVPH